MKHYREVWKELARTYSSYTPPCSPSNQDISHIEVYLKKILKHNKEPSILILGCTGNYRKLFSKYKLKVDLVDTTKEMFMYDPKFLNSFKRKEKFITANWLDMNLNKKHDIIVGDFVAHQFPLRKRYKFLKNVQKHLKDGGFFITRIFHHPTRIVSEEFVINAYKNKKPSFKNITELNWFYVHHFGLNKKTNRTYNRKGYLAMKKAEKKYLFMKEYNKVYEANFPTGAKWWTILPKEAQIKEFENIFKIIETRYSKDYPDSEHCPTFILVKK